jgi:general secretion pathway protein C
MDAAKIASFFRERSPEQWVRTANRFAPAAVSAALVLLIAHQLAELTWLVVPSSTADRPAPIVTPLPADANRAPGADLSVIADAHLFGVPKLDAPAPVPTPTVVDAPDTTLSVKLTGLVAYEDPGEGQAIIANGRSQEKKYAVGQSIEGGSGASVQAIYVDRVIVNRNGRLEALRLPKEASGTARTASRPAPPPPPPEPVEDDSLREVITNNATKLTDVMRIQPQVEGGRMVGFRLNPGRDRATFDALGLKAGDVVTDINGMVLDDPGKGLQVFQALGEATQANVTVLRDGNPTVLVIDTSQLQSLGENRQ